MLLCCHKGLSLEGALPPSTAGAALCGCISTGLLLATWKLRSRTAHVAEPLGLKDLRRYCQDELDALHALWLNLCGPHMSTNIHHNLTCTELSKEVEAIVHHQTSKHLNSLKETFEQDDS